MLQPPRKTICQQVPKAILESPNELLSICVAGLVPPSITTSSSVAVLATAFFTSIAAAGVTAASCIPAGFWVPPFHDGCQLLHLRLQPLANAKQGGRHAACPSRYAIISDLFASASICSHWPYSTLVLHLHRHLCEERNDGVLQPLGRPDILQAIELQELWA
ncbi:hypothetical protein Vretifemale_16157 [Volvox reticuliferus]|uniref:Uncharacterized protein n=1 Tax=Volvox reticuliferus TaxID=1737510 RepID=A0A8J4CSZ9_9CHLO|nr:hypothetical protein Vretifemale_16157 [Volvox reticuliferus]